MTVEILCTIDAPQNVSGILSNFVSSNWPDVATRRSYFARRRMCTAVTNVKRVLVWEAVTVAIEQRGLSSLVYLSLYI